MWKISVTSFMDGPFLRSAPLNAAFIDFQAADSLFVLEGGKNIVFIIAQMMMVMQTISLRFHFNILEGGLCSRGSSFVSTH